MATKKKDSKGPDYKQAVVVQLAAFGLFGALVYFGAIELTTFNPSLAIGILILAIAAGVPADAWTVLVERLLRRKK